MSGPSRFQVSTVDFGTDLDVAWLAVIAGGLLVCIIPDLGLWYLLLLVSGYLIIRSRRSPSPADDRQDSHDR